MAEVVVIPFVKVLLLLVPFVVVSSAAVSPVVVVVVLPFVAMQLPVAVLLYDLLVRSNPSFIPSHEE
jgi:hypothetical protein